MRVCEGGCIECIFASFTLVCICLRLVLPAAVRIPADVRSRLRVRMPVSSSRGGRGHKCRRSF